MDRTDEQILELIKGNARISYQELGDAIGMSRVAARKRLNKLEREGIIRGYNTCIYRENDVTMFIDIVTAPGRMEEVIKVLCNRTAFIHQIFKTTLENHIHIVAVSDDSANLRYLVKMIEKKCGDNIVHIKSCTVTEVIKDVYGGVRYESESKSDGDGYRQSDGRSGSP